MGLNQHDPVHMDVRHATLMCIVKSRCQEAREAVTRLAGIFISGARPEGVSADEISRRAVWTLASTRIPLGASTALWSWEA